MDWLRGIAAVIVLIHHSTSFFYRGKFEDLTGWRGLLVTILCQGWLGVAMFFVISGFCIHLPHVGMQRLQYRAFAIRRFWRLYPPYLFVCCVALALYFANYHAILDGRQYSWFALGHLVFWYYGPGNARTGMGVTPVLWTIVVEVYFYLIYAIAFPILRRVGIGRAALVLLIVDFGYRLLTFPVFGGGWEPMGWRLIFHPERFAVTRFAEWLLGAWIAEALLAGRLAGPIRWLKAPRAKVICGILILAMGYIFTAVTNRSAIGWLHGMGQACLSLFACCATALALAGFVQGECRDAGRNTWVARSAAWGYWLANRSYSLYLVHYTVIASIGVLAAHLLHISDRDAAGGSFTWLFVTLLGALASLLAADLTYRFIEAPSHRMARRLAARTTSG